MGGVLHTCIPLSKLHSEMSTFSVIKIYLKANKKNFKKNNRAGGQGVVLVEAR